MTLSILRNSPLFIPQLHLSQLGSHEIYHSSLSPLSRDELQFPAGVTGTKTWAKNLESLIQANCINAQHWQCASANYFTANQFIRSTQPVCSSFQSSPVSPSAPPFLPALLKHLGGTQRNTSAHRAVYRDNKGSVEQAVIKCNGEQSEKPQHKC